MKLFTENYVSPIPTQGAFENVSIEETSIIHKGKENFLSIQFDMTYLKNDKKVLLASKTMQFWGMENDANSSNKTTLVRVDNPNFDPNENYITEEPNPDWFEGSDLPETITFDNTPPQRIIIPLFKPDGSYNVTSMDFEIVDYGFPTYEKALQMFEGGSFEQPEIIITEPLAIGFVLNKLFMNGEPVGNQFELV
jgi:hypothetical protein